MDIKDLKLVSLIPARGGSERIFRKNIKEIAGKPMLAWTIEASLKSKHIKKTIVVTEDYEIERIAKEYGSEVIIVPLQYMNDKKYALLGTFQRFKEYLWDIEYIPDYIAFLYPTSPLRTSKQIDEAYELMLNKNCNRVYSVYKIDAGVYEECWIMDDQGKGKHIFDFTQEQKHLRNMGEKFQEDRYIHTNEILIMPFREALPYTNTNYSDLALYEIPKSEIVDINTDYDFMIAEMVLKKRING
jgi:CMP-N-acetylneuraminic acid synthetase